MNELFLTLMGDLNEFQYRLHCGSMLLMSVHDCGVDGEQDQEAFLDSLFGACLYIESLSKELAQIVENQFAITHGDSDIKIGKNAG